MNYRTPAQIAEAAVRMANAAGLVVSAPKAVRDGRWDPVIDRVPDLEPALLAALPEELEAIADGLLAVIAPARIIDRVRAAVTSVYGSRVGQGAGGPGQDIVVTTPREVKGLEFDGVVVLEPAEMLKQEAVRVGDLYVAMTRPTQRLRLISTGEIPEGIED